MIIKSMPVKKADWGYHYSYLAKENNKLFSWNLSGNPHNQDDIINEFKYNYEFLKQNIKAKNVYYHEVISLPETKNYMSEQEQEQALYDLTDKYIYSRANNNLVLGAIHKDSENIHMHLIISANEYLSTKSTRLSKKEFRKIQRDMEIYKNKKYPQLETNHYELNHKAKNKQKRVEQEINRQKRQTKKQKILNEFKLILNNSNSKQKLYENLKNQKLVLYKHGKYIGLINLSDNNRKYRLKTLEKGLDLKLVNKIKELEKNQKQVRNRVISEKQKTKQQIQNKGIYHGRKK